ncbi:MAG TPA: hypothetical protein VGJ20_43520, partial [Xanthobacteraceae bacterium]
MATQAQRPDETGGAKSSMRRAVTPNSGDGGRSGQDEAQPVDVTVRKGDASAEEVIAQEARKGYDLLFIG